MQLHRAHEQFTAAGVPLTLVGMGSPRQAGWFRRRYAPSLHVLADERRVSYRAMGLRVGSVGDLFSPASVVSGLQHAARSRVVQGRAVGNPAQLGGALVVAAGGDVLLEQRARHAGDSADPAALLAALG